MHKLLTICLLTIVLSWSHSAVATLEQARELAQAGKIDAALQHVDDMLQDDPNNIAAKLLHGVFLSHAGRQQDAIKAFLAISLEHPSLPEPHNNLAVLYAAQSRYQEAQSALRQAIDLQPDYDVAQENLGDVYIKLAELAYARAQQINPANQRAARKAIASEVLLQNSNLAPNNAAKSPPRATQKSATVNSECVQMPEIPLQARQDQVAQWLRAQGLLVNTIGARTRYQVSLPAEGGITAARARVEQLHAAGIKDLFIIAKGENANSISLGVFGKRASAERRAQVLADKGIQTQIVEYIQQTSNGTNDNTSADHRIQAHGTFSLSDFAHEFPEIARSISSCG